jgi:KDO2-lipid IV(A) lauroyltransferase
MADRRSFRARAVHLIEGIGAFLMFGFFGLLPVAWASWLGGSCARLIGPRLRISRRARRNLKLAMPELDDAAIERILRGVWDNLGRVVAEFPHLRKFNAYEPGGRIEIAGQENVPRPGDPGPPALFFSAHYGNWEMAQLAGAQTGLRITQIYRAANNPIVDRLINQVRSVTGSELVPKGATAARSALAALHESRPIAMLVDQKLNDGIAVPFFGRDAMTAPALARLALRFGSPVLPVRVERLPRAHFRIVVEPPIRYERSGDAARDTLALMTQVNQVLERWIRARPDHWFWLHRRWPD